MSRPLLTPTNPMKKLLIIFLLIKKAEITNANEIAKICLYLVKENQAITGQNIVIDGGYSCLLP